MNLDAVTTVLSLLQKLAKQGDSEAAGEALVAKGNEIRAACHLIARGSVAAPLGRRVRARP